MGNKYGCEICSHRDNCEQTPFGICRNFEAEGEQKNDEHLSLEE
jgi:hypothetical protein